MIKKLIEKFVKKFIKKTAKVKVNYTAFNLNPKIKRTDDVMKVVKELAHKYNNLEDLLVDKMYQLLVKQGVILSADMKHNLIPTTGFNVLCRRLAGDTTYTGEVTDWALGSGTTAFTVASTQLNTETERGVVDTSAFDDNIVTIDSFIGAGDIPDATYEEFGYFIDGDGSTPNDGQAWSLLITGGWVKSGSLFISGQYTFANA
jgi:hypothetical protein